MSGFRDQLVDLFTYSDAGSGGVVDSLYTYAGSFWGRLQQVTNREITLGDGAKQRIDAVLTLDLYTTVDPAGLIGADGHYYRIVGPTVHREVYEQVLTLVRADDDSPNVFYS